MPEPLAQAKTNIFRRHAPEIALAVLALVTFGGRLGAMELWGKREQRAVAEALNTVDENNWLVATIQCRPRLEKPPLPRWTTAALMTVTGLRDEWIVRLPNALSALAMIGLVYGLGRRMAGRSAGLAAGLILLSTFFFVIESRQAGNDGPLAFFTTLALYAAFRRLHGGPASEPPGLPGDLLGSKGWSVACWAAMGLGFLSKGPIAAILPALAVVPYLLLSRRLKVGGLALLSVPGIVAFVLLALSWPVPVVLSDPRAAKIWWLEMGQKAGAAGITHHRQRSFLREWPWLTAPWTLLATWAVVAVPLVAWRSKTRPVAWFAWSWAVTNFAMFCLWSVAKPNYYVPCEPGVALLCGLAWVSLLQTARGATIGTSARARRFVQFHWLILIAVAAAAPVLVIMAVRSAPWMADKLAPEMARLILPAVCVCAAVLALGVATSVVAWRRRADSGVLAGMVGGMALAMVIGYASVVPRFNAAKSHRALAADLNHFLSRDVSTVMFFRELDEGLWFYLKDRALAPVPGSAPKYSKAADLQEAFANNTLVYDDAERNGIERQVLVDWLKGSEHQSPYVLIREKVYKAWKLDLDKLANDVYHEPDIDRPNPLVLLRVKTRAEIASAAKPERK